MLSSKNILDAKIVDIKSNEIQTQIEAVLENGKKIKAIITSDSAKNLELAKEQKILAIFKAGAVIVAKNECKVRTSCANEYAGKITKIDEGSVNCVLYIDCGGVEICAAITLASCQKMQLAINDDVNALIKANSVVVGIVE